MDHQGNGHVHLNNTDGSPASYGTNPYEPRQLEGTPARGSVLTSPGTVSGGAPQLPAPNQLAYQHIQQQQQQLLRQQLQTLWANLYQENEKATDFKNHSLPLARIKKIMKADEDVRMISAEAPIVFARACEMFILELTLRSWNHTREDVKDESLGTLPRGPMMPVGAPSDTLSAYCYMPGQESSQGAHPGMMMNKPLMDPMLYTQQPYAAYLHPQMWSQPPQQSKSSSDS